MNKILIAIILLAVAGTIGWVLFGPIGGGATMSLGSPDAAMGEQEVQDLPGQLAQAARRTAQGRENVRPVEGVVYGPDGKVVVHAEVVLSRSLAVWPERRLERLKVIHTDQNGWFRFARTAKRDLVVEVVADGLQRRTVPVPREAVPLTVSLARGFSVKGIVLSKLGSLPVENCQVLLEPGQWSYRRSLETVTDDNGRFQFDNVPAGVARVTCRMQPYLSVTHQAVTIGSPTEIRLEIDRQVYSTLEGKVSAGDGLNRPITGAEILVYPSTAWNWGLYIPLRVVSDAEGKFKVHGVPRGSSRVVVRHPDYSSEIRIISAAGGRRSLICELEPRVEVKGRIVGAPVGTPLLLVSQDNEIRRTAVQADGVFQFPGKYSVGWGSLEIEGGAYAFEDTSALHVELELEEFAGEEITLVATPAARISGRVVDEGGAAIAGVEVSTAKLGRANRSPEREITVTNSQGEFQFSGLAKGSVDLRFQHVQFATQSVSGQVGEVGSTSIIEPVKMVAPGVIRGRITRGGEGLVGAIVFAGRGQSYNATAVTGEDGRYRLRGIAPRSYRVKARYSTLPLQVAAGQVAVASGAVTDAEDLEFPAGYVITGLVHDKRSMPIADAYVIVRGKYGAITSTDVNGVFSLEVTEDEVELLIASQDMQVTKLEQVTSGVKVLHSITLPMEPRTTLTMRVIGLPGRRPVTRGVVRFEPLEEDAAEWEANKRRQRTQRSRWVEMQAGVLRLEDFPQGRSRLVIQCPGFAPKVLDVDLNSTKTKNLGHQLLEPGLLIRGVVHDMRGKPVVGASVMLGDVDDLLRDSSKAPDKTAADGSFELRGVSPDSLSLVVGADGCAIRKVELRIPRDTLSRTPLKVTLLPSSTIEVHVRDYDGSELMQVDLWRNDHHISSGEPDENGLLLLEVPSPGQYFVSSITHPDRRIEVSVGDQPTTYRVDLDSTKR